MYFFFKTTMIWNICLCAENKVVAVLLATGFCIQPFFMLLMAVLT